ncbi:MAG: type II secretion system F family protein, partial [Candidatus Omnitrophica bacterium]|nr:type II secretion system F family protein [Candidatus Omnitrophota bacterium]
MPQFAYIAKDTEGKTVTGSLEFENVKGLIEALRQQGLVVVNVREDKKGASQTLARFSRGHVSLDELVVFTRMLATMVDSGIPIIQGLEILHEQVDNTHFKNIILLVKTEIEKGSSFSNALSRHKPVFSNLYVSMVRAGESSGTLDEILDRLANYLEKMSNLIKK